VEALELAVAPSAEDQQNGERWGFVDEHGNIWSRASAVLPERNIGRMRGRDPLVALAALARRFRGLEVRAAELAERVHRSPRPSRLLNEIRRLAERVRTSEALGDYDALFGGLAELEQVVLEAQRLVRERKEELCAAAEV